MVESERASAPSSRTTMHSGLSARQRATSGPLVPITLYLFACAILLFKIGSHPAFAYNWEHYTAWHIFTFWADPSLGIFRLTDGVMTESGRSPLISLPVWMAFELSGVGLVSMRVPVAIIAAIGPVLLWITGRRLTDDRTAFLAASLLTLSPVYLLFGRSATLVGLSLVPALATLYFLVRCLQVPQSHGHLLGLQLMLAIGAYAYGPIRILWPLSIILFSFEALIDRERRRWLLLAAGMTLLFLPAFVTLMDRQDHTNPIRAMISYYNARGEQVFTLNEQPKGYKFFLRQDPESVPAATEEPTNLAIKLVLQNAADYANLLADWNTAPTITDFWNARGRLYTRVLVPFFTVGLLHALWRARNRGEDRTALVLWAGLSLPLLFTSRVDVGRLIYSLPLLMLLAASGFRLVVSSLARIWARRCRRLVPLTFPLTALLLVLTSWSTWMDYRIDVPHTQEAKMAAFLVQLLPEAESTGSVALVMGGDEQIENESIGMAGLRLQIDGIYRVVNLAREDSVDDPDGRPLLLYGGLLDRLSIPNGLPRYCDTVYVLDPAVEAAFAASTTGYEEQCQRAAIARPLPK